MRYFNYQVVTTKLSLTHGKVHAGITVDLQNSSTVTGQEPGEGGGYGRLAHAPPAREENLLHLASMIRVLTKTVSSNSSLTFLVESTCLIRNNPFAICGDGASGRAIFVGLHRPDIFSFLLGYSFDLGRGEGLTLIADLHLSLAAYFHRRIFGHDLKYAVDKIALKLASFADGDYTLCHLVEDRRDKTLGKRLWQNLSVSLIILTEHRVPHYQKLNEDFIDNLWSSNVKRPDADVELLTSTGFKEVDVVEGLNRTLFKNLDYLKNGHAGERFLITGLK